MLTPKFKISQSDEFIVVIIHAPYTKVSDVDIFIDHSCFAFHAKPYFLRLELPGCVLEEGSSCKYEVDDGAYTVQICKQQKGEHFKDLDLITTLLEPKKLSKNTPLIEVISAGEVNRSFSPRDNDSEEDVKPTPDVDCSSSFGYGFANQKYGVISKLQVLTDFMSIKHPDDVSFEDRAQLRQAAENLKFDSDYYLADLYEDEHIQNLIKFTPPWMQDADEQWEFTEEENNQLQKLPNKHYIISESEQGLILNGLYDILFAYAYNERVNEGEGCVESPWNIRTLSPTLSWCTACMGVRETTVACARRVMCYPQYRNWELACKVQEDVIRILKRGRRYVLKCFLEIWRIFQTADGSPCYILNDLYITDYCVWLQKVKRCDEILNDFAQEAQKCRIKKEDLKLELELIEEAAELVLNEETEQNVDVDE
uniref:Protein SHQ1 homolog n=1 Tax=Ciona savignyi TaxID=51511 RepID=H2YF39_CIOSA